MPERDPRKPQAPRELRDPGDPRSARRSRDPREPAGTPSDAARGRTADSGGSAPPAAGGRAAGPARAQNDERGRTLSEWSVETGQFKGEAIRARIQALTDPVLEILTGADTPPAAAGDREPGAPDRVEAPKPRRGESPGGDPYSSGPARRPEEVTFNPYDRRSTRKR